MDTPNSDETIQDGDIVEYNNNVKMEKVEVEQNMIMNIDVDERNIPNSDENAECVKIVEVNTMEIGSGEQVTMQMEGPRKRCEVAKYFSLVGNRATCMCKTPLGGICGMGLNFTTHNMKRHLKRRHSEVFTQLESNVQPTKRSSLSTLASSSRPSMCLPSITGPLLPPLNVRNKPQKNQQKIIRKKSKEDLEDFVLSLVVYSGVPFNFFDNHYWEDYLNDEFTQLGVSRDPYEIEKLTIAHAKRQQDKVTEMLKDQFIFLKIDSCKCGSSKYFAVNVQFFNRNTMQVERLTLSVLEVNERHTALELNEMLEEVLGNFSIKHEQILMAVSDNATVMIGAVERFEETGMQVDTSELGDDDPLMAEALELMFGITYMRCGARTLQLAIQDGLDKSNCKNLLAELQVISKASSETALQKHLANVKEEEVGVEASWCRLYLVVELVLEFKSKIQSLQEENEELAFSEEKWKQIESARDVLEAAYTETKKLQEQSLLPGKFFYQWKKLEFNLNKMDTPLAQSIAQEMKQREFSLFKNEILLAAIYIDPQCRDLLSSYHQQEGRNHFINLAVHIKNAKSDPSSDRLTVNTAPSENLFAVSDDPFELALDTTARERIQEHQQQNRRALFQYMSKVNDALTYLDMQDRSKSLFEAIQNYQSILQNPCLAASSIPTTQSSVERLCIALKFLKSSERFSFNELSSNSILFLRLNGLN